MNVTDSADNAVDVTMDEALYEDSTPVWQVREWHQNLNSCSLKVESSLQYLNFECGIIIMLKCQRWSPNKLHPVYFIMVTTIWFCPWAIIPFFNTISLAKDNILNFLTTKSFFWHSLWSWQSRDWPKSRGDRKQTVTIRRPDLTTLPRFRFRDKLNLKY